MAKKRALVDATLQVASLSEMFTQDLEDLSDLEETNNIKINFGKHKGRTLEEIYKESRGRVNIIKDYYEVIFSNVATKDDLYIADDLRGSVDGWDFKQYVLGLLFYRFISENIEHYVNDNQRKAGIPDFEYRNSMDSIKNTYIKNNEGNLIKADSFLKFSTEGERVIASLSFLLSVLKYSISS